jgi:hypothetical protein
VLRLQGREAVRHPQRTARGEIFATLHGALGITLAWTERQALGETSKTTKPAAFATGF